MESETFKTLKALATGTEIALNGASSGEYSMQGEELYKGDVNLSVEMGDLVDRYAAQNNAELTLFLAISDVRQRSKMQKDKELLGLQQMLKLLKRC